MSLTTLEAPLDYDNTTDDPTVSVPLVLGGQNYRTLTDSVLAPLERNRPTRAWYIAFSFSLALALVFVLLTVHLILRGVGVWGNNNPVAWGFPIVNFVFWVGIGHAGTLISAILFLLRQRWRTSINRFAEAMTIFAVICAGLFPAIHIGRIWFAYWLFPVPNQMSIWPNFRSPLLWDVFAVSTYFTVSLLFWYMGMVPDLATIRDRSRTKARAFIYTIFAMGWNGSQRHWHRFEVAYLLLAALATPLVLSVHSVVSFDFAVAQLPGWHTTIFPPYFVAGAIFSGFAMVLTLLVPCRQFFGLKHIVSMRVLENMNKIILAMGCIVGYAYTTEFFIAAYSGNPAEQFTFLNRAFGPYWWAFWTMFLCNAIVPHIFWFKKMRTNIAVMFVVSILVNVGMWFERFVIVITSLSRDFLPSSWGYFKPTAIDVAMLISSFGIFFTCFLLFLRFMPMVAMAEVKCVMPEPADDSNEGDKS